MIAEAGHLTVTEQVFRALCRRAAGGTDSEVAATGIGAELALAVDEVASALRALELADLMMIATRADTIYSTLTNQGIDRCRQNPA
jgi:predicted nuclease with TOPRIM domain